MKKILQILTLLALASFTLEALEQKEYTYSYFGIGMESFTYKESGTFLNNEALKNRKFQSKVTLKAPVYQTGTVLKFQDYFISMDFFSTLMPQTATEIWSLNDYGKVAQNNAELTSNSMLFLYHHFFTQDSRVVGGFQYVMNNFKRFGVDTNTQTLGNAYEERSSSLIFDIGYWYESKAPSQEGFRYTFNALYGFPVYQNTKNTNYPTTTFDSGGYNFDSTLYGGYTIAKGVEVGLFLTYSYMKREENRLELSATEKVAFENAKYKVWPENTSSIVRYGLRAIWNFN